LREYDRKMGVRYETAWRWFRQGDLPGQQLPSGTIVVFLPHSRFIQMLADKAQLVGIQVIVTEESYTSKCSFLDHEPLAHQERYAGKRLTRGLFQTATSRRLNADVNGAYNMLLTVVPDAFGKGRAGVVVHPVRLCLTNRRLAS
jgi:putative transposase